jgi:hypothetical protein
VLVVPVQDADTGVHLEQLPRVKGKAKDSVGGGAEDNREEEFHDSGPPRRLEMPLIRFGLYIHHDVGRLVAAPAEEDVQSEASEWELRERREREEERRQGAEELGAGGENPLFLPTSSFIASAEEG